MRSGDPDNTKPGGNPQRGRSVAERTFDAIPPRKRPEDFKELRRLVLEDVADEIATEGRTAMSGKPPVSHTLESAYGAVTPINRPEDFREIERQAKEEHVESILRKMREN